MFHEIKLLDHGYIKVVEHYGSDERIIEAARMSTGKGFQGWGGWTCNFCGAIDDTIGSRLDEPSPKGKCGHGGFDLKWGDERLLRFLYENHHATPFEMAGLIIEVKAPIFVFREWHRHRVPFSYNEMSARYTPLPDENYIPSVERLMTRFAIPDGVKNAKSNKQAGTVKGSEELTVSCAAAFRNRLGISYDNAEALYQDALKWGIPKELARVHLPVGRYSRMRASSNLRGWLNFLALRSEANPGAQWEIRQYGNALETILKSLFPRTMALFQELKRAP